ncbi:hypothetical protein FOZ62_030949, partial [Perkinsus olseni]
MLLANELQNVAKQISDLEGIVCNLARGVARLAQVVGVFPRLQDSQHDDEVDVDVELLQWQDCANNMAVRIGKTWQVRSQGRARSLLEALALKADSTLLRSLPISQEQIEAQLERLHKDEENWTNVLENMAAQRGEEAPHVKRRILRSDAVTNEVRGKRASTASCDTFRQNSTASVSPLRRRLQRLQQKVPPVQSPGRSA